jgi:hypothetical protein
MTSKGVVIESVKPTMAEVLLLTATSPDNDDPYNLSAYAALRESAASDAFHQHRLTEDPVEADMILFSEILGAGFYFERVRRHPLVRGFREKCFLFCANDFIIPFLPGIYASIEKRWASSRARGGFYAGNPPNDFLQFKVVRSDLKYLFSFIGASNTAPVREHLCSLNHPRSVFLDTSSDYQRLLHREMPSDERRAYERRYAETLQQSKFILCPRGMGPSSMRLFDTMRMGRVPIILSDDWVAPVGPRWNDFSIRVAEADWRSVPAIAEKRENDAETMGQLARAEWEAWFSPQSAFHRVVEWCLKIKRARYIPERWARWPVYLQYLRPFHLRHFLRLRAQAIRPA